MPRTKANGAENTTKIGHNSALTDDERSALTLYHKVKYEAADALVEKAKNERTAIADLAKSDLGKGALVDIKEMIVASTPAKMKAVLDRALRIMRYNGLAVGTQQELFERAKPIDAFEEGKTAGMEGHACVAPQQYALETGQKWIAGWHEGQTVLASAFKKKRPVEPPAEQIDLSERTDIEQAAAN